MAYKLRSARKAQSGEVVVVEITSKGAWMSEPLAKDEIGYRIGSNGRPEVSAEKLANIECEAIVGNYNDLDEALAQFPQVLPEY